MYPNFLKRLLDFTAAGLGLIFLSPIFVVVTVLLYFANKGTPFFYQKRPGLNEKIFSIIKFKTMNDKKDSEGNYLPDNERLTSIGAFVRKTSLYEIPQLINVFKGDMSLIGPRPLLIDYLPLYSDYHRKRHLVRPGITGWAQVNGRNNLKMSEKFNYDVTYVEKISFLFDIQILFKTFQNVLFAKDINEAGENWNELDDLGFVQHINRKKI